MDKKKELTQAVNKFEQSYKLTGDYMQLFMVVNRVLKPGSGLIWSEVEDAIKDAFNELYRPSRSNNG